MAPDGKRIGLSSIHPQPRKHHLLLNNSFSNLDHWISQTLKLFYFCGAYMYPCNTDHSTTELSHPGNRDLFYNTVWGLSNNFPLRPRIQFLVLTSVTGLHHKAQFTRRITKAVPVPLPSSGMRTRRKETSVRLWSSAHKSQVCRCLELEDGIGQDWWYHTDVNNR